MQGSLTITEEDRVDYRDYPLPTLGAQTTPLCSGPGDFYPYLLNFNRDYIDGLKDIHTPTGDFPIGLGPDQFNYFAMQPGSTTPAILLFTDTLSGTPSVAPAVEVDVVDAFFDNLKFDAADSGKFLGGFVAGFTGGGVDVVTGSWHFVKAIPGAVSGTYHYLQDLAVRYVDGDSYDFEQKVAAKTWEIAKTIAYISYQIQLNPTPIIEAIYQGSYEPLNRLAPEYRIAVEASIELIQELAKDFGNKTPYEQGTIIGDAVFQVLSIVLPMTKVGQLSKLAVLEKMNETAKFTNGSTPLAAAYSRIKAVGGLLGQLQTTKMCFVAGTLVHTAHGLVPIEQIHAGDLVLSRDEQSGTQAYKPVLNTIITHPDALYSITYDRDGNGPLPPETVVTTAPHPFWVVDEQKFVAAADLKLGEHFLLADGATADVIGRSAAEPAAGTTTYNFEVADFHTYFVGQDGVWVHNTGNSLCERIFSLYRQIVDTHNLQNNPWRAFEILLQKTNDPKRFPKAAQGLRLAANEVAKEAFETAASGGNVDLSKIRSVKEIHQMLGRTYDPVSGVVDYTSGRWTRGSVMNHHAIVKKDGGFNWHDLLGIPAGRVDDVPGMLLETNIHVPRANTSDFHSIFKSKVAERLLAGTDLRKGAPGVKNVVLQIHRDAFEEWAQQNGWGNGFGDKAKNVLQAWLAREGYLP